jgi:uncharacterized RDD family membrane protein YckC
MKSKFEPDVDSEVKPPAARLVDPDEYDASEQRFAASVEETPAPPRFVPDVIPRASINSGGDSEKPVVDPAPVESPHLEAEEKSDIVMPPATFQSELLPTPDTDSWRGEVADRVNNYRARRRPRAPRYPSLQLKFDPPQPTWPPPASTSPPMTAPSSGQLAVAVQETYPVAQAAQPAVDDVPDSSNALDFGAKILEFPRSAAAHAPVVDELADPVMDRPRILEVPDLLPPPPALGGITIEPVEEPATERRPGFELPLQTAPMPRRLLAGAIDTLLVISAFTVFAYIFFRVTALIPPLQQALGISIPLICVFWAAYQYLLLVYTGTTPGLRLARLQLSRFDGAAVPRKIRRWRVLASILSGMSLCLGYAWCFLDEDRLCWHDRITRTYMAPQTPRVEDPLSA